MTRIAPHGGQLTVRWASPQEAQEWRARARSLKTWTVRPEIVQDLWMLGMGAYSPLTGFMTRVEYTHVLQEMHLPDGWPWTIPIVLDVDRSFARTLREGEWLALRVSDGSLVAVLQVREWFSWDPDLFARSVFQTTDTRHPGVVRLRTWGDTLVAGPVRVLMRPRFGKFQAYYMEPEETRALFCRKGWYTVVAFQTRNPIHRAHEYLHKVCLELFDGLFIHPIVGSTKQDDVPAEVRMRCYETILTHYYPRDRVVLAINPAAMRYAGPREAVFHAIIRKNFGCTHFIVGRDHAGVGGFYDPWAAQRIFEQFDPDRLGIRPIRFRETFYCRRCLSMATERTCPHGPEDHLQLSGTRLRELLRSGQTPPAEITRPEVADVLMQYYQEAERSRTPAHTLVEVAR